MYLVCDLDVFLFVDCDLCLIILSCLGEMEFLFLLVCGVGLKVSRDSFSISSFSISSTFSGGDSLIEDFL